MLAQLSVRNFAIVKSLDLSLRGGMTTITGETGAGKSIAIDALGLCLGERTEAAMVRPSTERAEISALFQPGDDSPAIKWLKEQELECDEEGILLRRTVSSEGRSRAWINGRPVSAQQLKALAPMLVAIHGQHAHQALLKPGHQLAILDRYAGHDVLRLQVKQACRHYLELKLRQKQLLSEQSQRQAQQQLLEYQVAELDQLALQQDELPELNSEHSRLSHAQSLLSGARFSLEALYESDQVTALALLQQSLSQLEPLTDADAALTPVVSLLHEIQIQLQEACSELQQYESRLELDPERLNFLDDRLGQIHALARKHQVAPEELFSFHQQLTASLNKLSADESAIAGLADEILAAEKRYLELADQLSVSRQRHARKLGEKITAEIRQLAMPDASFCISVETLDSSVPRSEGIDDVEFQVTTNPGQPLAGLNKVASGGELSRISLAIQVITSHQQHAPTLIFDEVDTGISGATASVVGRLLRQLGDNSQLLCVTHLPQVAGCGHQQLFVEKRHDGEQTETSMLSLTHRQRVKELARMLAGDLITPSSLASAEELLSAA